MQRQRIERSERDTEILDVPFEASLAFDPMIARMDMLKEASAEDRLRWITSTKALLLKRREDAEVPPGPFGAIVREGLIKTIDVQLQCLEKLRQAVLDEVA